MSDDETIYKMERLCFLDDCWTQGAIKSQLSQKNVLYSIYRNEKDEPVGYFIASIVADEAELYRIAVIPDNRRKGYASELMKLFLSACKNEIVNIFLEVRSNNVSGIALYEKFGFKLISRRKNYYKDDDALIYCLSLI